MSAVESETPRIDARVDQLVDEAERARGHGDWREAADRYLQAARVRERELDDRRGADALELRAADCLLRIGALGPAWRIMRALLEQCGIQPPRSPTKALLGTTWRRGRFMLRRPDLDEDDEPPTAADHRRCAVLERAAESLGLVHTALADSLRTHLLAEVARCGDASARCRALASEVAMQTRIGSPFDKSVKKLLERCAELAAQTGEPRDEGWRQLAVATYEFSHGRWRSCVEACEAADGIFAELADEGLIVEHERARVSALRWFALAWLGELGALRERLDRAIAQAEADKDSLLLLECLTGQPMLAWLAADDVEGARARTAELLRHHEAIPGAPWPENGYRRQHYRDLMAEVHASLYRGEPLPAWVALCSVWRELESTFYLPMRTIGLELRSARARVAAAVIERFDRDPQLTAAKLQAHGLDGWDRARLVADLRSQLEQIGREQSCIAPSLASLLAAALANLEARREDAQIQLDAAVRGFNSVEMALHRECARYALGELIGGVEGGQLQDRAAAWMRRAGVVSPRKLAASQAPGFALG